MFRATASGVLLTPTLRGSAPTSPIPDSILCEPPTGFSIRGCGVAGCGTFAIEGGTESLVVGPNSLPEGVTGAADGGATGSCCHRALPATAAAGALGTALGAAETTGSSCQPTLCPIA